MEFKFRSIQERSSTYFTHSPNLPPPPNFSYFTQQAIRAGFTASEDQSHWEFHRNPNDFREAMQMQRELEKERIRAEIIAEEIMRRRILEEEVRRELMMEREMAMRFGSRSPGPMRIEPRLPLLANFEHRERFGGIGVPPHREMGFRGFETLPFQRDPVASGSGAAGNRTPSSVTLQEITAPVSEVSKEKVIILAKPTITSAADLKRKAATQAEGATAELISSESKKQKTKDDWSCALCRISATSERGLKDHLQGKKHKARERGLLAQKTGFGTTPLPKKSIPTKSKQPKTPGLENPPVSKNKDEKPQGGKDDIFQQKKENSVVKKKPQKGAVPKKTPVTPKPKKKFRFWCEVCKVGTYSQNVLDAHKKGRKHLANLSEVSETGETKTNPSKTSVGNAANEETKQERVGEKAEIQKGSVENNPKTTTDETGHKVENNPATTTDEKGHKVSESVCADVTLVEDANNPVVPENLASC